MKTVNWMEVNSPNSEEAFAFYSKIFGWTKSEMDMGEMGKYTMLHDSEGNPFAGIMQMTSPEWDGVKPHWMIYFHTDNVDTSCQQVKEAGGKVCYEPFDIPGTGRIAICEDPHGAVFSFHQPTGGQA
jgi:hypothetical protein